MRSALSDLPLIWRNHKMPNPRNRLAVAALHTLLSLRALPDAHKPGAVALPQPEDRPRILLLRADGLGDLVMTGAALQAVRAHFAKSHITLLVAPLARSLAPSLPWYDELITLDLRHMGLPALAQAGRGLRDRFDLTVDFRGDFRQVWFMAHTAARVRVGHRFAGLSSLLTHPLDLGVRHQVDEALEVAAVLGAPTAGFRPALVVSHRSYEEADRWLSESGFQRDYAVVHVSPSRPARRWTPDRFAAAIDRLHEHKGMRSVLIGTAADRPLVEEVRAHSHSQPVLAAGELSLDGLLGLLAHSSLFFGVDSGPMHMAAVLGIPVVGLFGPMSPRINGPYGERALAVSKPFRCPGCAHDICRARGLSCMTSITVEDAWAAICQACCS